MQNLLRLKSMKLICLLLVLFVVSSSAFAQGGSESTTDTESSTGNGSANESMSESDTPDETDSELVDFDSYSQQSMQGFDFQWKVDGDTLDVIISGPTTGWISVGFDPTNRMKDANYVMARVESNGEVIIEDHFGTAPTAHRQDITLGGTRDMEVVSGSEENGRTTVNVRLPLVSGDQFYRPLTPGESYVIIWAYGPNGADNFTTIHSRRGFFRIEL